MQYVRSNDDNYLRMQHNRSSTNPSPGPQPYRNSYPRPEPTIPTYVLSPGSAPLPQRGVYEYPEVQQRPPPLANSLSDPPVHTHKPRASPDSGANGYYYPQSVPNNARITTGYGATPTNFVHYPPSYSPQQMLSPTQPPPMGTNIPPPPPPPPPMYVRPSPQTYYNAPPPPPPPPMPQPKERHPSYYRTGPKPPSSPQQYFSPPRFMPPRPPGAPPMSAPAPAQPSMPPHALRAKNSFGQQQQQTVAKWSGSGKSQSGSYHGNSYGGHQMHRPTSSTDSQNGANVVVAYLRNWDRKFERSKFTTHVHCLEPVSLINKLSPTSSSPSQQPSRGNLLPLFKASEDWIAPTVGLPLENRPGYRCLLYIVDGSLVYDNGLSGEKLLSKGTLHLSTTNKDVKTYVKNPSKTHRAHIIRLWIETDLHRSSVTKSFPDYSYKIRHIADSDMQNCLLTIAQPANYHPSFGMTARIYGPFMPTPMSEKPEPSADSRPGAVSPLESAYYMSQSVLFTRPDYFTPDPVDFLDSSEMNNSGSKEWGITDPELTSRVCVDPLLVDEDVFISVCTLDCDARIVYEPYDLHDEDRRALAMQRNTGEFHPRSNNAMRGNRRRLWIQTLLADFNIEATANGGRLVINGDGSNRMRPGDSAYIRRIEITDKVVIENCGRAPIEFMLVETPY
ncbi:hypothetical protein GGH94_003270 [Coemansia aciculifera]|uniref:Uncharacterized protein n=1 Tax=Coemansia aciculifera TaxID=417176 RepID=A0A9W8IP39_9FUNG|nr:hypothetical protein GGH94_003270 [Coemansia aciculifera]